MASHFATGTTRRTSPAYCKKGSYLEVPPYIDGRPAMMNAFVDYRSDSECPAEAIYLMIRLTRDAPGARWVGQTGNTGCWVRVQVIDTSDPETFQVLAELFHDADFIEFAEWFHSQPIDDPRWDTGSLNFTWNPATHYVNLHVLA